MKAATGGTHSNLASGSPCHHGMARPQVEAGRDGLQIWSVAADILNNQSRTADSGWSSSLGVGRGLTTPHRKTSNLLRTTSQSLGPRLGRPNQENEVGAACGTHGRGEKRVHDFGGKAQGEKVT
jgi:hypothetical protein